MKWIYYIVVFLLLNFVFFSIFTIHNAVAKELDSTNVSYHNHQIKIEQVHSDYPKLNQLLKSKMNELKNNFLKQLENNFIQNEIKYTLDITSESFCYQKYISYIFFVEEYLGGAHPNHIIWTIVYDTEEENVIDLDDLIEKNVNFLAKIQKSIRSDLLLNPKIVNTWMMLAGTELKKENFQYFVLDETGIIFYFLPYQVAPYSSGIIKSKVFY